MVTTVAGMRKRRCGGIFRRGAVRPDGAVGYRRVPVSLALFHVPYPEPALACSGKRSVFHYAAALGGVDCIVFTAGVGENSGSMRASICDGLEYLGVKLDPEKNKLRGEEVVISTPDSKVTVWVIPTNEELMIAQDTAALTR